MIDISSWLGLETGHSLASIRWGLTLLHFLWQGAIVGLIAFLAEKLLRNHSASVRYWLNAVALLVCPICVAWTFTTVDVPESWRVSSNQQSHASLGAVAVPIGTSNSGNLVDVPYPKLDPPRAVSSTDAAAVPLDASAENPATAPVATEIKTSITSEWMPVVARWIAILYAVGVVCFFVRLAIALWGGHRLRAISTPVSDSALLELIRTQAHRIGLKLVPVVAYCERIAVPTVIGVLCPMILLPATLTTGLTTDELSAILSHELAHIRRYDLWMNLLQRIIESLLFFHPVVWFLSHRLSAEREICCDDLVIRSGHQPMNYAGALLRMAELCVLVRHPQLASLSAAGRSSAELEHRIVRLMQETRQTTFRLNRIGILVLLAILITSSAVPAMFRAMAQQSQVGDKGEQSNGLKNQVASHSVEPRGTVGSTARETGSSAPIADENGIYWGETNEEGLATGVKVLHLPSEESAKLILQYVLRSSASEPCEINVECHNAPMSFLLDHRNLLRDVSLMGRSTRQKTISIQPNEIIEDQAFRQEADLSGLDAGEYSILFRPVFLVRVEGQVRTRIGLPFNLVLPLVLPDLPQAEEKHGEVSRSVQATETANEPAYAELPIHWGKPVHGLRVGAMFVDAPADGIRFFDTTDQAQLNLFVQNVSKETLSCLLPIPHPTDGWRLKIENSAGTNVESKQLHLAVPSEARIFSAFLGPDEIQPITGNTQKFRDGNADAGNVPEFKPAEFLIAPGTPKKSELRPPFTYGLASGEYIARVYVEVRRTDTPSATLQMETMPLAFHVGAPLAVAAGDSQNPVDANKPANAVHDADITKVEIRYPRCIVDTEDLPVRTLPDAVAAFNLAAQESPTGSREQPVTEKETFDAIAQFALEPHMPKAVRAQWMNILKSGELPSNVYFRRFTRFDDGKQMQGVWWVRLVVETGNGPVYSVPVRSTSLFARPYTQMERQQNADGLTLINRVVSYYEEPPLVVQPSELPAASIETLIRKTQDAIKAEDDAAIGSLFESTGASETQREFAVSELKSLAKARVRSIKVSPLKLKGELRTWSAWQYFKPNLPVVAFLEIEYEDKDAATRRADAQPLAEERKVLSLELGLVGDELRLVNYVADGERTPPESLNPGPSITGHLEPLADGTHLVTDIITNPGTLLSAHLANEEIRQRDFRNTSEQEE